MSKATRPCGPPAGTRRQASSTGPRSPTLSRSRRAAGARSAGSSAVPSRCDRTAEMFSRQEPPTRAACHADSVGSTSGATTAT
eukprot:5644781-Alexandrium_andersonii.AAC.1